MTSMIAPSPSDPLPSGVSWMRGALLLGLGLALGGASVYLALRPARARTQAAPPAATRRKYICPMHAQIILDHEGDCPICGMKLVPVDPGSQGGGAPTPESPVPGGLSEVTIDPERQQLIGLSTVPVTVGSVGGQLRAVGRVAVDETRVRHIHVKVDGYVEKLFVDYLGMTVAKGQRLFTFYSPEFVSAQREYLLALSTAKALAGGGLSGSGKDLLEASRRRLALWDVPQGEVDELEKGGVVHKSLTLSSPIAGVVTAKSVVEGNRLTPADTALEITDLSRVWAVAEVYESEIARVKVGMAAHFTLSAFPGKTFPGRVAFIDPQVDPRTRTIKVRLELPNPGSALKPEMFGEAVILGESRKGLQVPMDAVLDSGTRKIVFLALGKGRFLPREVETGTRMGENVEIRSGLEEGQSVVTRANFLVDSESRLRSALADLTAATPAQKR